MTTDDSAWRRPEPGLVAQPEMPQPGTPQSGTPQPGTPSGADSTAPTPPTTGYQGPPRMVPPPPGWRPAAVIRPAPPRNLPPQDLGAIDEAENEARTVTYGIGLVAGAVMLIMLAVVCGRLIL